MINLDRDALTCDFAEVYHVLDWRGLPARLAATLAMGMGPKTRIRMKQAGTPISIDILLSAIIADAVTVLAWRQTKDGMKGGNKPKSFTRILLGVEDQETAGFDTAEEFNKWRNQMIDGGEQNGRT